MGVSSKKMKELVDNLHSRGITPVVDTEFEYLSHDYAKKAPLYNHFLQLKDAGELPSFDNLSDEQLRHLWYIECISDAGIARLFGVSKSKVTRRRTESNITTVGCLKHAAEFGGKSMICYPLPT